MDRKIAAALVSALAIGLTGCGSSGPKLTREQLVSKIETACHEAGQTTEREMRTGGSAPTPVQYGAAIVAGQRVLEGRLKNLNPPDAAKQEFIAFRTGIQHRLHMYEQMLLAVRNGQQPSTAIQAQNLAIFHRLDALAKRQGFSGCI